MKYAIPQQNVCMQKLKMCVGYGFFGNASDSKIHTHIKISAIQTSMHACEGSFILEYFLTIFLLFQTLHITCM